MKRSFLNLIIITSLVFASINLNAQLNGNKKAIKTKIDNYLSNGVLNGFSGAVLVAKKGKVVINKGYGMANKVKNIPNTSTTVFDIGSNTKQFTGAAILKLVQFNKLKVTDPLSKFFNNLPDDKKDITVHQLLTHSAGFIESIGRDFDHISREKFFKKLFATELLHEPGSKYSYSNVGYSILARIIELVSDQDYEAFLNENLFKPAGMKQTGYLKPEWNENLLAQGYTRNVMERGSMVSLYKKDNEVSWHLKGNGGINSTQKDMFRWIKALKTNKVLSAALLEKYTTPYKGPEDNYFQYSYGWGISKSDNKTKRLSHNGSNGTFSHSIRWFPEDDILVLYATNASSPQIENIARIIEKIIFDENYQPEPIRKNPYFLVYDFTKNNSSKEAEKLFSLINREYSSDFKDSGILNRLGYVILEKVKNVDWAIELFKMNVQLFPEIANLWDSLGDGYKAKGDKQNAIVAYQKAYKLDPTITASINSLAELGITVEKKQEKEIVVDELVLKSYVGKYELKPGFTITITIENGKLTVQPTGRDSMSTFAKSTEKFFLEKLNAHIQFNKNTEGKINSLTILDGEREMLAKRL